MRIKDSRPLELFHLFHLFIGNQGKKRGINRRMHQCEIIEDGTKCRTHLSHFHNIFKNRRKNQRPADTHVEKNIQKKERK